MNYSGTFGVLAVVLAIFIGGCISDSSPAPVEESSSSLPAPTTSSASSTSPMLSPPFEKPAEWPIKLQGGPKEWAMGFCFLEKTSEIRFGFSFNFSNPEGGPKGNSFVMGPAPTFGPPEDHDLVFLMINPLKTGFVPASQMPLIQPSANMTAQGEELAGMLFLVASEQAWSFTLNLEMIVNGTQVPASCFAIQRGGGATMTGIGRQDGSSSQDPLMHELQSAGGFAYAEYVSTDTLPLGYDFQLKLANGQSLDYSGLLIGDDWKIAGHLNDNQGMLKAQVESQFGFVNGNLGIVNIPIGLDQYPPGLKIKSFEF